MSIQPEAIACAILPAVPDRSAGKPARCAVAIRDDRICLSNAFLSVEIGRRSGVVERVTNRLSGSTTEIAGDRFGFAAEGCEWFAQTGEDQAFQLTRHASRGTASVTLSLRVGGARVAAVYRLGAADFWVERRLSISRPAGLRLSRLDYGRMDIPGADVRVLPLGRFDRPRLACRDGAGLFAGVGWWFYQVDAGGVYHNVDMGFDAGREFCSEPWYVGVFASEAGEPYPGWLWYRHFLERRKMAHDRQACWTYWNLGWGQWGIDVDNPLAGAYLEFARDLGIRQVAFGSGAYGKGAAAYVRLAQESESVRRTLKAARRLGVVAGFLDKGSPAEIWSDEGVVAGRFATLEAARKAGYGAYHFDFFATPDTYVSHERVTRYFRACRETLDYTECHLGMALYGPQFQREVVLNHPTDTHGFDIGPFGSDWATFLSFRHSRARWQTEYDYLMPEFGLYYFITHYLNPAGEPRHYCDPEPQQFLCRVPAFTGLSFNFHDALSYRTALAASSAFSPHTVFGHLDLTMPDADIAFTRDWLRWVRRNAAQLRLGRVCVETPEYAVVSKLVRGRGVVYVLNYGAGRRRFDLTLGEAPARVRVVWPSRGAVTKVAAGGAIAVEVPSESLVMLDVNGGLLSPPPCGDGKVTVDVAQWQAGERSVARVAVPHVAGPPSNPLLPAELSSFDQRGFSAYPLKIEDGRLPEAFRAACGFRDDRHVATGRFAPWAYADRWWLVWRPAHPVPMSGPWPVVELNGAAVSLVPRVNYRPPAVDQWVCPVLFADVTGACRPGAENELSVAGLPADQRGIWYLVRGGTPASDRRPGRGVKERS